MRIPSFAALLLAVSAVAQDAPRGLVGRMLAFASTAFARCAADEHAAQLDEGVWDVGEMHVLADRLNDPVHSCAAPRAGVTEECCGLFADEIRRFLPPSQ